MADTQIGVLTERPTPGVAEIVISNPGRLNALGTPLMSALIAAVEAVSRDESLRVLIVRGAGSKAFVGGADIAEMAGLDRASATAFITLVHRCCKALRDCPVPVIARIEGYALGAGLELAAACDIRVAADTASVGMPEVKLGMPSVVEAALLPMLIGWGRTRELLLLGEIYPAAQAAVWGLIEHVVPRADLDATVARLVQSVLSAEPRAVRLQKALIRSWEEVPPAAAIRAGIDAFTTTFESDAPVRAIAAFRAQKARRP